jgi:excisionase family DNA binding protein
VKRVTSAYSDPPQYQNAGRVPNSDAQSKREVAAKRSRILGVKELAEFFRCSREKIKRGLRDGKPPAFKFGKSWFVREADLEAYLQDAVQSSRHLRRDQEEQQ